MDLTNLKEFILLHLPIDNNQTIDAAADKLIRQKMDVINNIANEYYLGDSLIDGNLKTVK